MTACVDAPDPQPGQTNQWTYDADCSTNQACTFQCGDNRILNETNYYCEDCPNGFSPNSTKTACVCVGVIEDRQGFESCEPCQNGLVPNADNTACECGSGLYYSTEYNHCMSRESCVGGVDLIVNDNTRECNTCEEGTVPNNDHTACVCPAGECADEDGVCSTGNCGMAAQERPVPISQIAPGMCVGPDGSRSQYPRSDSYSGDIRSCENGGRPQPGETAPWVFDQNCSSENLCTFRCNEGLLPNSDGYCEPF